jgi:rhodanese-related sulfurtransferase
MDGYKNIDVAELRSMLAQDNVQLVDVRTDAEIGQGYIKGALKLPLHLLPMKLHELDSKSAVVFYCRTGGRSAQAAAFAAAQGFQQAYNLQGGIFAWAQSGEPLAS